MRYKQTVMQQKTNIYLNNRGTQIASHHKQSQKSINSSTISNGAKVYIPINAHENPANPVNVQNKQNKSEIDRVAELQRLNNQLKQKQELYIDKLLRLQQGLQRQHLQFMQLEGLYNEIFSSYKQKEEEIAELELKYRESDRNRRNAQPPQANTTAGTDELDKLTATVEQKTRRITELQSELQFQKQKNQCQQKQLEKLFADKNYQKSKQKINDSRVSLNFKVMQELEYWQRTADSEKQQRIEKQYENEFLKSRNSDLEARVKDLEGFIVQKQSEIVKLRQSNITLNRESSEARLSRSKSPRSRCETSPRKEGSSLVIVSRTIEALHAENKKLKEEIQRLKSSPLQEKGLRTRLFNQSSSQPQYANSKAVPLKQYFSFSHEEQYSFPYKADQQFSPANSEPDKKDSPNSDSPNLQSTRTNRQDSDQKSNAHKQTRASFPDHELEELPKSMEVENLIKSGKKISQLAAEAPDDFLPEIPNFVGLIPEQ